MNGDIERFKTRLVARGFSQKYDINYKETFTPTIRSDSLRILLAVVAIENLEYYQIDVSNAFTETLLKHDIFMQAPSGYDIPEKIVLKVDRNLYGLKQAAKDWHDMCLKTLINNLRFQRSPADLYVFIIYIRGLIVGLYVNNLIIAAKKLEDVLWFKKKISSRYKVKDLGKCKRVLGIRIRRNREKREMLLD